MHSVWESAVGYGRSLSMQLKTAIILHKLWPILSFLKSSSILRLEWIFLEESIQLPAEFQAELR